MKIFFCDFWLFAMFLLFLNINLKHQNKAYVTIKIKTREFRSDVGSPQNLLI